MKAENIYRCQECSSYVPTDIAEARKPCPFCSDEENYYEDYYCVGFDMRSRKT